MADAQQLGLFYGMPLLGPALGPLIGGALGNVSLARFAGKRSMDLTLMLQSFGWRASLYFISAFAGCCWIMFLFFPDTWRREVSSCQHHPCLYTKLLAVARISESNRKGYRASHAHGTSQGKEAATETCQRPSLERADSTYDARPRYALDSPPEPD